MNKKFLFGLLACMLLTIVFSACKIVDADTIPHNPSVNMGTNNFLVSSITISKDQSLDLIDTVASRHVILNGTWKGSTPAPSSEAGAPSVNVTTNGNDTATIGPFNTAGTFHIFCNIHQGMILQITVK